MYVQPINIYCKHITSSVVFISYANKEIIDLVSYSNNNMYVVL